MALVGAVVAALAVVAVLLPALPGGASELTEDERAELEPEDRLRHAGKLVPPEDASTRGFWVWPERERGYFLTFDSTADPQATRGILAGLVAVDLDSGAEVARGPLDPAAWYASGTAREWAAGRDHTIALDHDSGRLFVPYGVPYRHPQEKSDAIANATPDGVVERLPGNVARGRVCYNAGLITFPDVRCVGGVHVVDAESLDTLATIPLDPPRLDDGGGGFMPMLRAVRFTPAQEGEQGGAKVHLVVEDIQHDAHSHELTTMRQSWKQFGIHYAIQLDVDTGTQDWAVRLNVCRGTRDGGRHVAVDDMPAPAAVFRSPHSGDLFVGCTVGTANQSLVVRVPLDAQGHPSDAVPVAPADPQKAAQRLAAADPDGGVGPDDVLVREEGQEHWVGPVGAVSFYGDPASGRMVVRANPLYGEMWWVFDEAEGAYIGGIGIGDEYRVDEVTGGFDERTGRLYVLAQHISGSGTRPRPPLTGGLFVADIRGTPLPQALHHRELSPERLAWGRGVVIASAMRDQPGRVYYMPSDDRNGTPVGSYEVIADPEQVAEPVDERYEFAGLTLDLDEAEGVTGRSFDGAARGYGARAILVGGLGAVPRQGPADPVNFWDAVKDFNDNSIQNPTYQELWRSVPNPTDRCVYTTREAVLAFSGPDGPAVVDGGGSRGGVQPLVTDPQTGQDAQGPGSRCSEGDWDALWAAALFSSSPAEEPGAPSWPFTAESRSSCVSGADEEDQQGWSDPYFGVFSGEVACEGHETGGRTETGGLSLDGVSVTEAISRFRVYLDPERGLVARVESIARGVRVGELITIDSIRGMAESWANGRVNRAGPSEGLERALGLAQDPGPGGPESPEAASGEAGDAEDEAADCDTARTAGTCFTRHFFGVSIADPRGGLAYECGPCGDEAALVDALNAALGTDGTARLRNPDPVLARGADNGYIAGIVKPDTERFADLILNHDGLETVVPALEIIRYAPAANPPPGSTFGSYIPVQGRQIFQFAGVEVSSTYSIQCLLEYDPVANVCAESLPDPASLSVELVDLDGQALAGGAFELREDTDGDGVLGLVDELVEGGACATGPEGVCAFDGLEPGSYLVSQTAAPDGYAPVDEPLAVNLFPGDDLTVTFTNVPNFSTISLTVTALNGTPVEGAVFGVYPDNGDGTVADGAEPVATCVTDADGVCSVTVPPGAYVLRQLSAPGGLLPIDDIAFIIDQPGQTADVALTLGAAGTDPVPVAEPAAGPVDDFAPAPAPLAQPAVSIAPAPARSAPSVTSTPPAMTAPPPAVAEQVGGTIVRVIRSPANALRLAARSPIEAASLVMVLLLVGLAVMAVIRRQQLATLLAGPGTGDEGPGNGPGTGPSRPAGPSGDSPGTGPGNGPASGAGPAGGGSGSGGSSGPSSVGPTAFGSPVTASGAAVHAATAVLERPSSVTDEPRASKAVAATAVAERPAPPSHDPSSGSGTAVADAPAIPGLGQTSTAGVPVLPVPAGGATKTLRVVVATADPDLATQVSRELSESRECVVVGTAGSLAELRAEIALARPEVLVLDLTLRNGDLWVQLAGLHAADRTVGLIAADRPTMAAANRALDAGLRSLLAVDGDLGAGQLASAVRRVAAGRSSYGRTVEERLLRHRSRRLRASMRKLTPRQLEVSRLAAEGLSRTAIAKRLVLSPYTVKCHLQDARDKLGVTDPSDVGELRRRLADAGLLDDPTDPEDV